MSADMLELELHSAGSAEAQRLWFADLLRRACMQAVDISSRANGSPSSFNFYNSTKGRSIDPRTLRILAHTDESLITLLHTSPGGRLVLLI